MKKPSALGVASFFAGIGGFDVAFENAGFKVVMQCEISPFCKRVLKHHWPDVPLHADIKLLEPVDIPESAIVWCGGFPCQDVSLANQGKRQGLKGKRSGLFYEFARLVKERKPKWLVLENVPGLLNSHDGKDFQGVLEELDELGYGVSWRVLDAKYFGTPQRRRRVYIVGSLGNLSSAEVLFDSPTASVAPESGGGEKDVAPRKSRAMHGTADLYAIQHAGINRKPSAGPQAKGYRNDGETYTLDSRGSSDAVCKTAASFRVRKASRVSTGLDGNRYRAIGNAVCIPVAEWVARRIWMIENAS